MAKDTEKSIYRQIRDDLGYSREKASELMETIPPERIERIESGKMAPHPDEVLRMSQVYKKPDLCNYYCSNECPIGKEYTPEIKVKDLSQIVLEMVASLNSMHRLQERLIEITADGLIENDEIMDFVHIQDELEKISITIETLQLWAEKMVAEGNINMELYEQYRNKAK